MTTPVYPTVWYWVVNDTNPTTQVWEGSSGAFVANTVANYLSWVANGGSSSIATLTPSGLGTQINVTGAVNNGAGLIRLTVDTTATMTTNDAWIVQNVGGTVEANGKFQITVIDSTHVDLQGSAFVHAFTSNGVIDRGTVIDTAANLYALIDLFNQSLVPNISGALTIVADTQLTLPLPTFLTITPGAGGPFLVKLPQINLFGSPARGKPLYIRNGASAASGRNFEVRDFSGGILSGLSLFGSDVEMLTLLTNATKAGTFDDEEFWSTLPVFRGGTGVAALPSASILQGNTGGSQLAGIASVAGGNLVIDQHGAGGLNWDNKAVSGDGTLAASGALTVNKVKGNNPIAVADGGTGVSYLPLQGYLAGLTLSNDVGTPNTIIDIAAGMCCSDDATTMMKLAAFTKTTGAWAVGSGNGGLDTGAVANTTWYHVFVIERTDTGVVDALISTSATAPTMPANYTKKRRIGSFLTDGSAHIIAFVQDGDIFRWDLPIADVNGVVNPGTAAVTRTLTVPTGVQVYADMVVMAENTANTITPGAIYISDLALTDRAASPGAMSLYVLDHSTETLGILTSDIALGASVQCRTNTSAQVRSRLQASDANTSFFITTLGWTDRRGAR